MEGAARASRQNIKRLLESIYDGSTHLHIAWDVDEQKVYALAGSRIVLDGDDHVGEIVWLTGLERAKWLPLFDDFERYHKEYLGCVGMQARVRRGWLKDMKQHGYRVTRILVEKRL